MYNLRRKRVLESEMETNPVFKEIERLSNGIMGEEPGEQDPTKVSF